MLNFNGLRWSYIRGCSSAKPNNVEVAYNFLFNHLFKLQPCYLGIGLLNQHCHKTAENGGLLGKVWLIFWHQHRFFDVHVEKVSFAEWGAAEIHNFAFLRELSYFYPLLEQRRVKRCGMVLSGFA